ncbi:MAG: Inner membrane protein YqiK [candidate division BRC1 bacterium ADurb.BinA364]|nr:MAG: Inner membrane protein YqiK [candidate division BRC1 bacterium ADurb.BinA364]
MNGWDTESIRWALAAATGSNQGLVVGIAAGLVVMIFVFIMIFMSRYRKVGPNEAMIISGFKRQVRMPDGSTDQVGFRIVRGGGTFVWPVFERLDILSLELMTLDVKTPEVYTIQGVPVIVDGVAQIKVRSDEESISTAAQQLLSKGKVEVMNIALMTVEGHLRAILGTLTVEEIYKNRDAFAQKVQEVATADMANMGLQIVSFTIRDIKDNEGYLDALGKPRTAQVKRDAIIGQAEADRDATIRSAEANQVGQTAKFAADAKIAEAERNYQMRVQEYQASVNQKKAEADLAYELQKNISSQAVKREQVQIDIVERERMIELQEKEIQRKERELDAMVKKPADADYFKIERLAQAEKQRIALEAQGRAEARKAQGFADAEVVERTGQADGEATRARGLAEADIIKAQGLSEAEAMRKKAESWELYNEAAVTQMLVEAMPKIAAAISAPLAKTERIVIINAGGDNGGGASKITRDITNIVAQVPAVVEALTGVKLEKLMEKVPGLKDSIVEARAEKADGEANAGGAPKSGE